MKSLHARSKIILGCHLFLCSVCLSQWMALYCHLVASLGTWVKRNHRSGLWIKTRSALRSAHMPCDKQGQRLPDMLWIRKIILFTCDMHAPWARKHLANQTEPQLAVIYPDKISRHQFGGDCQVMMAEGGEKSHVVDENVVVKRNSTSAIWTYIGFRRDNVLQTQVLCKICWKVVATSRGKFP